jgi:maltose alpha-D-glucosyltransferase/alpha-amylase
MVTEEERQFLWHYYSPEQRMRINLGIRRRLAPLLNNNINKLKFVNALLFSLPGTPIIYYGDEIGMGDNILLNDRDGVRTPMQWSTDENAGFSEAPTDYLHSPVITDKEYGFDKINVEKMRKDPNSIFHFIKNLIKIRKKYKSLNSGDYRFFESNNESIMIFNRFSKDEEILLMFNFSDRPESIFLNFENYKNKFFKDIFSEKVLSYDSEDPIQMILDAYEFIWFVSK